jgi:hypothetical protein
MKEKILSNLILNTTCEYSEFIIPLSLLTQSNNQTLSKKVTFNADWCNTSPEEIKSGIAKTSLMLSNRIDLEIIKLLINFQNPLTFISKDKWKNGGIAYDIGESIPQEHITLFYPLKLYQYNIHEQLKELSNFHTIKAIGTMKLNRINKAIVIASETPIQITYNISFDGDQMGNFDYTIKIDPNADIYIIENIC